MKLSDLLNQTGTVAILVNNETINIKYRTNLLTDENKSKALENKDNDDAFLRDVLVKTIIEWDIVDDHNNPLPCNDEVLREIDSRILSEMWMILLEDSCPNVKTGNTSNGS